MAIWIGQRAPDDAEAARAMIIVNDIRLPRMTLGILVGASLAVSGVVMQGMFRNPLADPGLVGVSAGAGLGAVAFIVLGGSWPRFPPFWAFMDCRWPHSLAAV